MSLDGKGAPPLRFCAGDGLGRRALSQKIPGRGESWKGLRPPCLLGRGSGRQPKKARKGSELSGRSPKRFRNCPESAQKCPESVREERLRTVRKEPKKAQKLSGRSLLVSVREEPDKALKLSGKAQKLSGMSLQKPPGASSPGASRGLQGLQAGASTNQF